MPSTSVPSLGSAIDGCCSAALFEADPELAEAIDRERDRQQWQIELIASENIVSRDELVTAIFYHISTRGTSRLLQIALANDTCPNLGAKQTETTLSTSK